jgi:hypothetical protein
MAGGSGTLLREVETDTASLIEIAGDLDDLVLQYDDTAAGRNFISAWRQARMIVDLGSHSSSATNGAGSSSAAAPATPVAATH